MENLQVDNFVNNKIVYEIDRDDCIVSVNNAWDQFALQSHTEKLLGSHVMRYSLWDFVVDRETRLIYKMMMDKVRETQQMLTFHYRCDTPTQRRYMQMELRPMAQRHILFTSRLLNEDERPYTSLLDPNAMHSNDYATICSWCKQVNLPDTRWVEVEDAVEILHLFDRVLPQLTHGMCPSCRNKFLGQLGVTRDGSSKTDGAQVG